MGQRDKVNTASFHLKKPFCFCVEIRLRKYSDKSYCAWFFFFGFLAASTFITPHFQVDGKMKHIGTITFTDLLLKELNGNWPGDYQKTRIVTPHNIRTNANRRARDGLEYWYKDPITLKPKGIWCFRLAFYSSNPATLLNVYISVVRCSNKQTQQDLKIINITLFYSLYFAKTFPQILKLQRRGELRCGTKFFSLIFFPI